MNVSNDEHEMELSGLPVRQTTSSRENLEVIASQFMDQLRSGSEPDLEKFIAGYPEQATELREFLPLVMAMEGWKGHQQQKTAQQELPRDFEVTQLGEFKIIREIARGGMGIVYEAEQLSLGRRVAVKMFPWTPKEKSSWTEQFQREARTAANLQHSNIVPIYSFGQHERCFYYAMQLIEGVGLDHLIRSWKRHDGIVSLDDLFEAGKTNTQQGSRSSRRVLNHNSWSQLVKICLQIVNALKFAHQQEILHRDIKPGNILFDKNGKVWITDFGLATDFDAMVSGNNVPFAGTLRFMAPEQFQKKGDARSDLFSLGVTLYEFMTLAPAFKIPDKTKLIEMIERGDYLPPRKVNPTLPPPLDYIIRKLMKVDPNERYQTAEQLGVDLIRFLDGDRFSSELGFWTAQFVSWPGKK